MRLFEAIAERLRREGVDTLFGLMGDGNLFLADHYARLEGTRYVGVAHESAAVLAALGYARCTGRVGVATVTHGPALTNTVTALVEGARARLPVVLIAGDTADSEHLQHIPQREVARVAEAGFVELRRPETWARDLGRAFRTAALERRPVVLDVPADLMWSDVPLAEDRHRARLPAPPPPREDDVALAVEAVYGSRRPLVLAGQGAATPGARAALLRLAERIGAPLATTLAAKDLFFGEAWDLGVFGETSVGHAVTAIAESDCVIAFGASLNRYTTERDTLLAGKTVIVCDSDPRRARIDLTGSVVVIGDAEAAAGAISSMLDVAEVAPTRFRERFPRDTPRPDGEDGEDGAGMLDIRRACRILDDALPRDRVLVTDVGRFMRHTWRAVHVDAPTRFVPTVGYGSIGLGMGFAIGAACASPGRRTVLVTGDGGYMLGGFAELTTAIRHDLELTVVVMNDACYGAEYVQFAAKGMDGSLTMNAWPDFAATATAAGAEGLSATTGAELRDALGTEGRRPVRLIDLRLDAVSIPHQRSE